MNEQNQGASMEMPKYWCHKEVWALKIHQVCHTADGGVLVVEDAGYAPVTVDVHYMARHRPLAGGYYVVYKDGYASFSPGSEFEDGYTRIAPPPGVVNEVAKVPTLVSDIEQAINRHSAENGSDTPDYILTGFLMGVLEMWNIHVRARERWYGRESPATGGLGPNPTPPG